MLALLRPLFSDPSINLRLFVASLFIHILGLASAFYAILVFGRYLTHGLDATLLTLTAGAMLALLMEHTLRRVRFRLMTALTARHENIQSAETLERLTNAPPAALASLDPQVRAAPHRALDQVNAAMTPANVLGIVDVPFALIFLVVLTAMAWQLGAIGFLFSLVAILVIYFRGLGLREATHDLQQASQAQASLLASAERADTVRLANAGPRLTHMGRNRAGMARLFRHRVGQRQDGIQGFIQAASALLSIITIAVGAKLVILGHLDFGALFGANILAMRMFALLTRPAQSAGQLLGAVQAQANVDKFLALPKEAEEGTRLNEFQGRIEFHDLAFGFPGGTAPLFEGVSLTVEPGQMVVVAGANSTGKTTLARLLAGLLEPTRGSIYMDGVDLRQIKPFWWRRQMVFLPQEPEFIDGSLRDNLMTLAPKLPPEKLDFILGRAGAKDFVDRHPKGLDMPIVQGGRTLSPGIRRRLALARGMTTMGRLVIIDEPSEGLDAEGIATVDQLIADFQRQGRTVIVMTQAREKYVGRATIIDLDCKPVPRIVRVGGVGT